MSRPWPSTTSLLPSAFVQTPMGSQKPTCRMLDFICCTCSAVCSLALPAYSCNLPTGSTVTASFGTSS